MERKLNEFNYKLFQVIFKFSIFFLTFYHKKSKYMQTAQRVIK